MELYYLLGRAYDAFSSSLLCHSGQFHKATNERLYYPSLGCVIHSLLIILFKEYLSTLLNNGCLFYIRYTGLLYSFFTLSKRGIRSLIYFFHNYGWKPLSCLSYSTLLWISVVCTVIMSLRKISSEESMSTGLDGYQHQSVHSGKNSSAIFKIEVKKTIVLLLLVTLYKTFTII